MNEELKAIDWLRAKTISYESRSEELHYALILYNLIMNLQKENQELKKELSNSRQIKNQQKKFIEWLENEISNLTVDENKISSCSVMPNRFMKSCFEKTLSKYKETIGVKNE